MFRSFAFVSAHKRLAVAARAAVVCVLVCTLSTNALAQTERTIAIVNLSAAPNSAKTAAEARTIITRTPGLRPTAQGDLAKSLEGPLPTGGPDGVVLARARLALEASETAFGEFKSRLATSKLVAARRELFSLAPSEPTTAMLADVSFHMALIHLRAENLGLALGEFQLLHRLVPGHEIDSVRYPPSIVKAFVQARQRMPKKASATVVVTATYNGDTVYLDGKPAGVAPVTLDVSAGAHIVAIASPKYESAARTVDIDAGDSLQIRLDLRPRSPVARAIELRFQAQEQERGDESLRAAAARVSRLVGSDAVLVILGDEGTAALYTPQLDRLSYQRPVDSKLPNMLALAMPVSRPTLLDGVEKTPARSPWYGVAAIAGAVVLGIIGGFATVGASEDDEQRRQGVFDWDF